MAPSRTVPQGVNAMLAIAVQDSLEQNVANMARALTEVDTGEVTIAVRDVRIGDVDVKKGDAIGLLNDTLAVGGRTPEEVVFKLLKQMDAADTENITVYTGEEVESETSTALERRLVAAYPDHMVQIVYGGQPHYHYIISTE
jgi:dihydroxyacetone kinase-like predicted kinase